MDLNDSENVTPENDLESSLLSAQRGTIPLSDFLKKLVASHLFVVSGSEVKEDGTNFQPVLYKTPAGTFVGTFTSLERSKTLADKAPFCLRLTGAELLSKIAPDFGVVINPGFKMGLELSASGIPAIRRDFIEPNKAK